MLNRNMKTSDIGIALICRYEGWRAKMYLCPANKKTIGYGHLVRKNEMDLYKFKELTKEEGIELLRRDLVREENHVKRLVKVQLNQNEFDALVSFTFNLGGGNLSSSTLLRTLNRGHYNLVCSQLKRWVNAGGRRLNGLVKRRSDECGLWSSYYTYAMAETIMNFQRR